MGTKVITHSFNVPRWKADLFISLFNAYGGDGFDDKEISEAEAFIKENNLLNLIEVEDIGDSEVKCTFITNYGIPQIYTYVLIGAEVTKQFNSFSLLPWRAGNNDEENFRFFHSFDSEAERDAYLNGLDDGNISEDHIIIKDAEAIINQWWEQASAGLKYVFSVTAECNPDNSREFWENLSFTEKKNIYTWCKIKAHEIQVNEDNLNSLRLEMASCLADLSISLKYAKPLENMCDEDGSFLETYQDDFNNILDEIEDRIMNHDY